MAHIYGFIGLGLIGGSIAKSLRRAEPDCIIKAYSRTRSKVEQARSEGVVSIVLDDAEKSLSACDIIFLCTPVEYNETYLEKIRPFLKTGAIVTDVGSTKSSIHELVRKLGMEDVFIGGHPMAGSEKTGYENSDVLLLENAYYMLTETSSSSAEKMSRMKELVLSMKAIPFVIDCRKHDEVVATISHLPHLLASSLVNLVKDSDGPDGVMKRVAAGGFKDITRIAGSSPVMWEQICETNREAILPVLDRYISSLAEIRDRLNARDGSYIHDLFERSGRYRNSISDENNGLLNAQYSFSVHIADRPGSISILSAILSACGINIKNIGINHSREENEGALRITFYDSESCDLAEKQLKEYHYRNTR